VKYAWGQGTNTFGRAVRDARAPDTAEDIIAIGQELATAKEMLGHGQFGAWLASEFEMSQQAANSFMHVAEQYGGKLPKIGNIPVSALYLLAAPSTPELVREAVAAGEVAPTHAAIKKAVADAKAALASR
jgi:hypothetical protein